MDDVRKQVLLDLFVSPWTLLPAVGGLSALILSWAMGGSTSLNLAGLAGVLGGAGMFATRLIFGLEGMTRKAHELLQSAEEQKQLEALDALDRDLRRDRDPRTQKCLREVRQLYYAFRTDVRRGRLRGAAVDSVLEHVEQLFEACVGQLQKSYDLWRTGSRLSGPAGQELMDERDRIVREVAATVVHLARTIREFHQFSRRRQDSDLGKLRAELDETMRVAQRTEQRLAGIGQPASYEEPQLE